MTLYDYVVIGAGSGRADVGAPLASHDETSGGKLPGRAAETIDKIGRQVQNLTQLVDKLLDVSRITAGRLDLSYEEADLAEIVRDVLARLEEDVRRSALMVSVRADSSCRGIWGPLRLDQIVTNLLSNALKYGAGADQYSGGTGG